MFNNFGLLRVTRQHPVIVTTFFPTFLLHFAPSLIGPLENSESDLILDS